MSEEARVVGQPAQMTPALLRSPADERVAGLALPGHGPGAGAGANGRPPACRQATSLNWPAPLRQFQSAHSSRDSRVRCQAGCAASQRWTCASSGALRRRPWKSRSFGIRQRDTRKAAVSPPKTGNTFRAPPPKLPSVPPPHPTAPKTKIADPDVAALATRAKHWNVRARNESESRSKSASNLCYQFLTSSTCPQGKASQGASFSRR